MDSTDGSNARRSPVQSWRLFGRGIAIVLAATAIFVERLDAILRGRAGFYLTIAGRLFFIELLLVALLFFTAPLLVDAFARAQRAFGYLWATRYQNARLARGAGSLLGLSVALFLILAFTAVKYVRAKTIALSAAGDTFVADAAHEYERGNKARALRLLTTCRDILGSESCDKQYIELTKREEMARELRQMYAETSLGNLTKAQQLEWIFRIDRDRAAYKHDYGALHTDFEGLQRDYIAGVRFAYVHDRAHAIERIGSVNARAAAYGDSHRLLRELNAAPEGQALSPFEFPYLNALALYGPDDFVRRCTKAFVLPNPSAKP